MAILKKTFSLPNPFAYFAELDFRVKLAIIIGFFTLILVFMYFTYQAGHWDKFMRWCFGLPVMEAKK